MFNFRLSFIILALIFPFSANSIFHKSLSPSDTSCEELGDHVEGMELSNLFGANMEILKIKNTKEISRTSEKLICQGVAKLSNGTEDVYEMEVYEEDGDIWYKVSPKLDFDFGNDTSTDQEEIADLKLNYEQQISDLKLKYEQEIRELKKELSEIKKLSVSNDKISEILTFNRNLISQISSMRKKINDREIKNTGGKIIKFEDLIYIPEIIDGLLEKNKISIIDKIIYLGKLDGSNLINQGSMYSPNGNLEIGEYANGKLIKGIKAWKYELNKKDYSMIFVGRLNDVSYCGDVHFQSGAFYQGCLNDDFNFNDDNAIMIFDDGSKYFGKITNGQYNDENAKMIFESDPYWKIYEGSLVNQKFHGKGRLLLKNENFIEGTFKMGSLKTGEYNCHVNSIKKIDFVWQIENLSDYEKENGVALYKLKEICEN